MGSAFCPVYGEKSKIRFKDEMYSLMDLDECSSALKLY